MKSLLLVAALTFAGPVFAFDLSLAVQRLSEVGPICVQHGNPAFAEKTEEEIDAACNETEALLATIEANGYCQLIPSHVAFRVAWTCR